MLQDPLDDPVGGHVREPRVHLPVDAEFFGNAVWVLLVKVREGGGTTMDDEVKLVSAGLDHFFGDAVWSPDDHFVDPFTGQDTEDSFLKVH